MWIEHNEAVNEFPEVKRRDIEQFQNSREKQALFVFHKQDRLDSTQVNALVEQLILESSVKEVLALVANCSLIFEAL